jgi:hypothetical protein
VVSALPGKPGTATRVEVTQAYRYRPDPSATQQPALSSHGSGSRFTYHLLRAGKTMPARCQVELATTERFAVGVHARVLVARSAAVGDQVATGP